MLNACLENKEYQPAGLDYRRHIDVKIHTILYNPPQIVAISFMRANHCWCVWLQILSLLCVILFFTSAVNYCNRWWRIICKQITQIVQKNTFISSIHFQKLCHLKRQTKKTQQLWNCCYISHMLCLPWIFLSFVRHHMTALSSLSSCTECSLSIKTRGV